MPQSPIGTSAAEARSRRRRSDPAYRAEEKRIAQFEAIARIVIKHRMRLGLTQEELAQRMKTSHSAVSRIESGRHRSSVETLQRLSDALGLRFVMGFESGSPERPQRELVSV